MNLTIETEQEDDGRWIAEVLEIPGVLAYGLNRDDAIAQVQSLAQRVLADGVDGEAHELCRCHPLDDETISRIADESFREYDAREAADSRS